MKRRDFIKTSTGGSAAARRQSMNWPRMLAAVEAARRRPPSHPQSGEQSKGFRVNDKTYKDAGAYDNVHCDQFGIDSEGNPIADGMTGTGSDAGLKEHDPDNPHKMTLTRKSRTSSTAARVR